MPQISKYPLNKEIKEIIFNQFWSSVSRLKTPGLVASFFSDLLSDTEEIMLVKRFAIAMLILRGKRPVEISSTLHVSFSAIASVSSWVKNAKPATKKILNILVKQSGWQAFFDKIEKLIDALPPRHGTDWSEVGKRKWQRKMSRSARKSLL